MLQLHWHGAETNEASSKRKSASDKQDIFVDQDFSSLQYEKKFSPYQWEEIRSKTSNAWITIETKEKKNVLDQDFSICGDFYTSHNWHSYSNFHVKNFHPWLNVNSFMIRSQVAYWNKNNALCSLQRNSVQHPTYSWEVPKPRMRSMFTAESYFVLEYIPALAEAMLILSGI